MKLFLRKTAFSAPILFLWVSLGCAASGKNIPLSSRPDWVDGGWGSRYPEALYIVGLGVASGSGEESEDRQKADQRARAEIAKQIRVEIAQQIVDIEREERRGDGTIEASGSTEVVSHSSVDLTLEGVQIRSRWVDPEKGTAYSLAVLDREEAASRLAAAVDRSIEKGMEWDRLSREYRERGDLVLELKALAQAWGFFWKASQDDQIYNIVRSERDPLHRKPKAVPPIGALQSRLLERISDIELQIIGGDQQRGEVGRPLAEKLRIRAVSEGVPISGLPIYFSFISGRGELEEIAITDAAGEAASQVDRIDASGKSENAIGAMVFPAALIDEEEWSSDFKAAQKDLKIPQVTFRYSLLTRGSVRIGVRIDQEGLEGLKGSLLEGEMIERLADAGFRVVDRSPLDLSSELSMEELQKRSEGMVDIVILGRVQIVSTEEIQPGFLFARAHGSLRGVRVDQGVELFSLEEEEKGAGRDRRRAGIAAIEELGERLSSEVIEALEKNLQ